MNLVIHSSPLGLRLRLTRLPVKTWALRMTPLPRMTRQPIKPVTIRPTPLPLMTSNFLRIRTILAPPAILQKCLTSLVPHMNLTRLNSWDHRLTQVNRRLT